MIPAAGIKDQELPIAAKWSGVNHPTVAWRGYLRALMGRDRQPLLGSTGAVRCTEAANRHAVDGQTQLAARRRERHGWRQPAGIAQRGKLRLGRILLDRALRGACRTRCRIEGLLELGDQVLEIVDAARQLVGAPLLCRTRTRSARAPATASASARISGTTAPSVIAVRNACRASSGRTKSAGGGRRPTRCSAARISMMTARRSSSDF